MLKTNWKQPWTRRIVRVISFTLGIGGVLIPLAIIITTFVSLLSGKGNPHEDNGMKVSDVVIMNSLFILATCFVCQWIPMLVKFLFPVTYEVKDDSGNLYINRNGKNILRASRAEITNVQFITNVAKTSAGTEIARGSSFGDTLLIDYNVLRTNGRKKARQFKMQLTWLEDFDRLRLNQFIASFLSSNDSASPAV